MVHSLMFYCLCCYICSLLSDLPALRGSKRPNKKGNPSPKIVTQLGECRLQGVRMLAVTVYMSKCQCGKNFFLHFVHSGQSYGGSKFSVLKSAIFRGRFGGRLTLCPATQEKKVEIPPNNFGLMMGPKKFAFWPF